MSKTAKWTIGLILVLQSAAIGYLGLEVLYLNYWVSQHGSDLALLRVNNQDIFGDPFEWLIEMEKNEPWYMK